MTLAVLAALVSFTAPTFADVLSPKLKAALSAVEVAPVPPGKAAEGGGWDLAGTFPEPRTYQYDVFRGNDQAYEEARRKYAVNRYQILNFFPDGRVTALLTDIPSGGKYELNQDEVQVRIGDPEVPGRSQAMIFTMSRDGKSLRDPAGKTWARAEKI